MSADLQPMCADAPTVALRPLLVDHALMSDNDDGQNSRLVVFACKLTDTSLRALRAAQRRQDGQQLKVEIKDRAGHFDLGSVAAGEDGGRFSFTITSSVNDKDIPQLLRYGCRTGDYTLLAPVARRIQVHGTEQSFEQTRQKALQLQVESEKSKAKEVKKGHEHGVARKIKTGAGGGKSSLSRQFVKSSAKPSTSTSTYHQQQQSRLNAGLSNTSRLSPTQVLPPGAATTVSTTTPVISPKNTGDITKRSLRQRLVHLLVLRSQTKQELIDRLTKEGITDADRRQLDAVLVAISTTTQRGDERVITLKATAISQFDLQWPFYVGDEKDTAVKNVKRMQSAAATPASGIPSSIRSSAPGRTASPALLGSGGVNGPPTSNSQPATSSVPPRRSSPLDDLLPLEVNSTARKRTSKVEVDNPTERKKSRLPIATGDTKTPAETATKTTTPPVHVRPPPSTVPTVTIAPPPSSTTQSQSVIRTSTFEEGKDKSTDSGVASDRPVNYYTKLAATTVDAGRLSDDYSESEEERKNMEHWSAKFPPLTTYAEAEKYAEVFQSDYPEYMRCYEVVKEVAREFGKMGDRFEAAPEGTDDRKRIEKEIQKCFKSYQKDVRFCTSRRLHASLRAKLAVIKERLKDWQLPSANDNNTNDSNQTADQSITNRHSSRQQPYPNNTPSLATTNNNSTNSNPNPKTTKENRAPAVKVARGGDDLLVM